MRNILYNITRNFSQYIKTKYEGQYWHALAQRYGAFLVSKLSNVKKTIARKRKHICMLAYSFYESDNRIMRYADALAAAWRYC